MELTKQHIEVIMKSFWKCFIECSCMAEGIMLSVEDDEQLDLAFFHHNPKYLNCGMRLEDKIRWCWKIITTGEPYTDMVILNKESARKLMNELKLFLAQGSVDSEKESEEGIGEYNIRTP